MPTAGAAAAPAAGVPVDVAVDVAVDEPVSVGVPDEVAELLVAGAEEDVLVDGDDCVGVGDCRLLAVGLTDRVAVGVFDAAPRLVPGA
jgi:hypothetical protein